MTLGKVKVLPKYSMPSTHSEVVKEEFRRHKCSRVTSKVIKTWKYFDSKPDIHAVKKIKENAK